MKTGFYKICFFGLFAAVFLADIAFANPAPPGGPYEPAAFFTDAVIALVVETAVLALLTERWIARRGRFMGAWFLITLFTCGVFLFWMSRDALFEAETRLITGEAAVLVVEAFALLLLLRSKAFAGDAEFPPSFARCLGYSVVGWR